MFAALADAYHRTKKPRDLAFNRWVARPLACVVVVAVARTPITPNQLTFASLFLFFAAAAGIATVPSWLGLVLAAAVLQLSYVVDMADGQLARYRGKSSAAGAHLDYMADEIKALLLVVAVAARQWRAEHEPLWLLEGMLGAVVVATAVTFTSFLRRPEVVQATGKAGSVAAGDYGDGLASTSAPPSPKRSALGIAVGAVEALGKFVVHYPTYFWLVALLDRTGLFLHVYLAMNLAYAGKSFLIIVWRMGRGE